MRRLLLDMNKRVSELKSLGRARLSYTELASWLKRYQALLAEGCAANPPPATPLVPRPGRPKKTKAINLLDRMLRHQKWVLAFLHDFRVPFTNNHAEQIRRIDTVRKHDRPIFQALVDAIAGRPFMPTLAA
jgi:transposase